ncbi:TlpA family protein disulfide reductase [Gynurincola endophyticus]|uniref:TlpA family protein disulfide reductase n=1 Tax=Gynurincola endophyticus TaxID=2479004 RepID=UPI000F8D482C|nr:TlpA disulfide reductase family protein [Gynurincola endophyticus]
MKQIFFLLTLLSFSWVSQAQEANLPPYKRFPTLPPFEITTIDRQVYTKSNLEAKPTVIMFFSPTCDHCQHQVEDFQKNYDKIKQFQFVLACYTKPEELSKFINDYNMHKYPAFKLGIDTKYVLPPFYDIKSLPFIALYDKKGKLIKAQQGNMKVDDMIKALQ